MNQVDRDKLVNVLMDGWSEIYCQKEDEEHKVIDIMPNWIVKENLKGMTDLTDEEVNLYMMRNGYKIGYDEYDGYMGWKTFRKEKEDIAL